MADWRRRLVFDPLPPLIEAENAAISRALDWFVAQQKPSGVWELTMLRTADKALGLWLSLAICRVIKRLYD